MGTIRPEFGGIDSEVRRVSQIVDIIHIVKQPRLAWMSSGALARALDERGVHLSAPTLQRYAREGRLPARTTPGGHYRFDLSEVLRVLDSDAKAAAMPGSHIHDLLARHRDEIRAAVLRHHGTGVYVFGSVARGDATPDSDIDLLVDFAPGSSLFDVLRLTDDLEQLLGRRVDVVSSGALKDRDDGIRREAIPL